MVIIIKLSEKRSTNLLFFRLPGLSAPSAQSAFIILVGHWRCMRILFMQRVVVLVAVFLSSDCPLSLSLSGGRSQKKRQSPSWTAFADFLESHQLPASIRSKRNRCFSRRARRSINTSTCESCLNLVCNASAASNPHGSPTRESISCLQQKKRFISRSKGQSSYIFFRF